MLTIDPCPGCRSGITCRTPACGRGRAKAGLPPFSLPLQSVSTDCNSARPLKDHEIRELVDTLTAVAQTYREAQQLRCRISHVVLDALTSHNLKAKP